MQGVDLKKRVLQLFHQIPETLKPQPIFLAVSGGRDSSVLASVALELREQLSPLHFVHVNYHLRRPDSDFEEKHLAQWATQEGIPFHVKRFYPKEKPKNLQAWAREKRLNFFVQLQKQIGKGKGVIWVAHHQQDQAETILDRMLRGAGLKGMGGMNYLESIITLQDKPLASPLYLFRPFLEVPTQALLRYAQVHRLKFFQDTSNLTDQYLRNRIRRKILPLLKKENPRVVEVLAEFGRKASDASLALEMIAKDWGLKNIRKSRKGSQLSLKALKKLPEGLIASICEQWILTTTNTKQAFSKLLPRILQYVRSPKSEITIPLRGTYELILQKSVLICLKMMC